MQINAVIIDDEKNNIENLSILLREYCPQVTITAVATNADEGKRIILDHTPDLVFLDIEMPGKNGFDLLRSLSDFPFEIIFVTAYDQYGIQAVKFSAIDYLLKPVNPKELKLAVDKVIVRNANKHQNQLLQNLVELLQEKNTPRIALPGAKETRFVKTASIIRCESSNNYSLFYLLGGEKIITSRPIFEYEELLMPYGFIRCHQSHVINKNLVKSWVREDGGYLVMEDNSQVPVSRNRRDQVKQFLK